MKKLISLLLFACLLLTMVSCGETETSTDTKEAETQQKIETTDVRVITLNGTTGFGMATVMADADNGTFAPANTNFTFSVQTDASVVSSMLINGEADIACLPTNAASNIYNKTNGAVQVLAINTTGCLFLLSTGTNKVTSLADLSGKTVYAPAQNPTFILKSILQENGLNNVTVDNTYAEAATLKDAVASGAVDYAVLPEPMVSIATAAAKKAGKTVTNCLDLTAEWNKLPGRENTLVQGCVVARTAFINAHNDIITAFLAEYNTALTATNSDPTKAGENIVKYGVFTNATVATNAIPKCNITYIDGEEMKTAMNKYLSVLYNLAPASIGNAMPGDDFYYIAK